MYKINPLGIYIYDTNTKVINNISWKVNSICNDIVYSPKKNKNYSFHIRIINNNKYGISLKVGTKNVQN